jgi:hypothetical protein
MKKKGERTAQMNISMPLSVAAAVDEEALLMNRSYSDCAVVLLRIGLDMRRNGRVEPEVKT